ncbi:MAG TPA: FtsW/RodA/SpoVE family cell cycle protein, partial [Limnochordia bacterium]
IVFGMLFVAGARARHLVGIAGLGALALVTSAILSRLGLLPLLREYQVKRLLVFLNPYAYKMDAGWNVIQSMIAIGSGRFFGKGLFAGSQTQLNFLPSRHTDFIFSVIGEELGFIGAFGVLALFFVLLWRTVQTIGLAKDKDGALIVTGVLSMLVCHLLINVGMTLGVMPVTGIPLPFISYGGSSFVTNAVGVALVLNVAMRRRKIMF